MSERNNLGREMLRGSSEREKASSHYALGKVIKAENPDYSIFCELSQRREQGGYLKIKKGGSQTNRDSPLSFLSSASPQISSKNSPSSIIKNPASMHKSPIDSSLKSSTKSYKKQNFRVRSFGKHS